MALVDRAPPSRFAVIERGGRLVVIDRETGVTPPTAAERMEAHDRALGVEPVRPPKLSQTPDISERARAASGLTARPAPMARPTASDRTTGARRKTETAPSTSIRAPIAANVGQTSQQQWASAQEDRPRPDTGRTPPARISDRPTPSASGQQRTIVTGKWWDAKGPRTLSLGPKGQAQLRNGFITIFAMLVMMAIVGLLIQPLVLLVGAFILLRFGGKILAPMGAAIVDKAMAERD